eukprot:875291-Prorocentrum_minimum.AAC.5
MDVPTHIDLVKDRTSVGRATTSDIVLDSKSKPNRWVAAAFNALVFVIVVVLIDVASVFQPFNCSNEFCFVACSVSRTHLLVVKTKAKGSKQIQYALEVCGRNDDDHVRNPPSTPP